MNNTEPIRIPLREAGGPYGTAGRYDGDYGTRMGRHSSKTKDRVVRAMRKKHRKNWKNEVYE